ncbi:MULTISPECIES: hypothetical protein [unclassified Luteibacter]|uniref:hypothetical protein n=1 Tax=Luteibacter sp. PvP019 TaxID=3156436 RepID=UPI003395DF25
MHDDTEPQSAPQALGPRLVFPAEVLARVPSPIAPDHLLKESVRDEAIVLSLPFPLSYEAEPGDTLQLTIDRRPVGDITALDLHAPGETLNLVLAAADRPLSLIEDRRVVRINYEVYYGSGSGANEYGPDDQTFVTDIVRPGRDSLAALSFNTRVIDYGVTPDVLAEDGAGNRYLPAIVKGYATAAAGDWIQGRIDDDPLLLSDIYEMREADVGTDVEVRFPAAMLEAIDGGRHAFSYLVVDRAGNVSQQPASVDLDIRLSEHIDDLLPPTVPAAADGLVTSDDARIDGGVKVVIPGNAAIRAGDAIVVLWNAHVSAPYPVLPAQEGRDPLMTITSPYDDVYTDWLAATDDTDRNVPARVDYRVERGISVIGTPAEPALPAINLFGPGGRDPDPLTPVHENMPRPDVRGASGDPANVIRAEDVAQDATATIAWEIPGAPGIQAFAAGDRIQLFWAADPVGAAIVVDAPRRDVVLRIPSQVLRDHSPGTWPVRYTASRTLATVPFVNMAASPDRSVSVEDYRQVPGEGELLLDATFVEWVGSRVYSITLSDVIDGTPVRIRLDQPSVGAGDVIRWRFQGLGESGEPIPGTDTSGEHEITASDMSSRPDNTWPKPPPSSPPSVNRAYVDITVDAGFLLPIVFGRATFDYTISNAVGTGFAKQDVVYVDVRTL